MKTIITTDIHGCLDEFKELLDMCGFVLGSTNLYVLGDLVDRGPKSAETVQYVRSLTEQGSALCLKGNHDDKWARYAKHHAIEKSGGKKNPMKLKSADEFLKLSQEDINWIAELPIWVVPPFPLTDWVFVHAGFSPYHETIVASKECMFIRFIDKTTHQTKGLTKELKRPPNTDWWFEHWTKPQRVMYGHSVHSLETPRIENGCYGIDTGCAFGGHLTAAVFEDSNDPIFLRVKSHKTYCANYVESE